VPNAGGHLPYDGSELNRVPPLYKASNPAHCSTNILSCRTQLWSRPIVAPSDTQRGAIT
jgi:hypothetical protein